MLTSVRTYCISEFVTHNKIQYAFTSWEVSNTRTKPSSARSWSKAFTTAYNHKDGVYKTQPKSLWSS
jgi:hypothetical protein